MSLSQICDIAYVLIRREIEDQVRIIRYAWATRSDGKETMPSLEDAYADFDKALERDSRAGLTQEELELRAVLGIPVR